MYTVVYFHHLNNTMGNRNTGHEEVRLKQAFRINSGEVPVWRRVEMLLKPAFRTNSDDVPVWRRVEMLQKQAFHTNSNGAPVRVLVDADVSTVGSVLKVALGKTRLDAHES